MKYLHRYILVAILTALYVSSFQASAQFKEDAFTQNYNNDADTTGRDSTDAAFTFKEFFGGIRHTRDARIGVMFAGSTVFIGAEQMYNRQYWKLPFIYGGLAATVGGGVYFRHTWNRTGNTDYRNIGNLCFAGAALIYWGTLMDGLVNYKKDIYPQAGKATLYSLMLPGLGQAYNGEYWKIPIYYGFLIGSAHFLATNNKNYQRYKWIHNQATTPDSGYDGPVSAETALYYRDVFRRYRDYSVVALLGFYVLQIIDANVFAYMQDFELTDDIALQVSPAVISREPLYAQRSDYYGRRFSGGGLNWNSGLPDAFGVRIGFTF